MGYKALRTPVVIRFQICIFDILNTATGELPELSGVL